MNRINHGSMAYHERNRKRLERDCYKNYKVTTEQYRFLRGFHKYQQYTPIGKYVLHRTNAKKRGVSWEITLWEWWTIWDESGKYSLRGNRKGRYMMCRHGDIGGYSKDNVYIATSSQNQRDAARFRRERAA